MKELQFTFKDAKTIEELNERNLDIIEIANALKIPEENITKFTIIATFENCNYLIEKIEEYKKFVFNGLIYY